MDYSRIILRIIGGEKNENYARIMGYILREKRVIGISYRI